jgi:hypothetical protein
MLPKQTGGEQARAVKASKGRNKTRARGAASKASKASKGEQGEPEGSQTPADGPQGDAADEGEGKAQGEQGEAMPDAGEGDSKGNADADGAASADEADGDAGSDSSGLPTGASVANQGPLPAPGTFTSEPRIMAIPEACKPTTSAQIFTPRIREPYPVTDEGMARGKAALADANARTQGESGVLVAQLRRMFSHSDRDLLETGKRHGRLRVGALHRIATGADTVFARRELVDGADAACAVLIDGSGSMNKLAQTANAAALLLVQALAKCPGVKTQVQVFQDGGAPAQNTSEIMEAACELGAPSNRNFPVLRSRVSTTPSHGVLQCDGGRFNRPTWALAHVAVRSRQAQRTAQGVAVIVDGGTGRRDDRPRVRAPATRRRVGGNGHWLQSRGLPHGVHQRYQRASGATMRQACDAVARPRMSARSETQSERGAGRARRAAVSHRDAMAGWLCPSTHGAPRAKRLSHGAQPTWCAVWERGRIMKAATMSLWWTLALAVAVPFDWRLGLYLWIGTLVGMYIVGRERAEDAESEREEAKRIAAHKAMMREIDARYGGPY